ncbi:flavin reductase family protein [Promethearchaeum syntrophicum]|uniref:Flavin reductase family protein n=1 Tax=Promethearchaeum syntrophicum TaxID=2594042 RepID=A0A5B9D9N1_9ARCH
MKKRKLKPNYSCFAAPHPTVVAGTFVNNKATYTTLGDFGILCAYPLHIYIASVHTHYLNIGIKENMTFSVNIPNPDNLEKTDYVGIVSGHKTDKSKVFDYFVGDLESVPMIKEFPITMECEVHDIKRVGRNDVFMAKVINIYAGEEFLEDGEINMDKVNPITLFMDLSYRTIGKTVGISYQVGRNFKPKP